MVRWNIQEVPINFNLFEAPDMAAARVLQNAPDGYMVFIYKVTKNKPLYHVVVVTPEEGEKIKNGSMKGHYKYQVKHIIQPGGSNADDVIIDTCNKYSIKMIFSNNRLFFH